MDKIIYIFLLCISFGCKRGEQQIVELKNASASNIYYIISQDSILLEKEIQRIRPKSLKGFLENEKKVNHIKNEEDSLARMKNYMYSNRIEPNSSAVLLSSESVATNINIISVNEVVNRRYNGHAAIFIIKEDILNKTSNAEIAKKKLYQHFITIKPNDITKDYLELIFE